MDQNVLLAIFVIIVLAIGLAIWLTMRKRRTDHLRDKFGDEYDRTVDDAGDRARAEKALEEREERVDSLEIRRLTAAEHNRFSDEWRDVKSVFVDSPTEAVLHADRMLATMMKTVGYPMADFDRRYEDLTVNHGDVARHYRAGHDIVARHNSGDASTEDLRQGMKHYEALYDHLMADADHDGGHVSHAAPAGSTTTTSTTAAPAAATTHSDTAVSRPATTRVTDVDGDGDADIVRRDRDGDGHTDHVEVRRD